MMKVAVGKLQDAQCAVPDCKPEAPNFMKDTGNDINVTDHGRVTK